MRLRDLPPDTNAQLFKLKLPARALKAFKAYAGGEPAMYPVGCVMGYDFMMSPEPVGAKERRLYPLPPSVRQQALLGWRVVEA